MAHARNGNQPKVIALSKQDLNARNDGFVAFEYHLAGFNGDERLSSIEAIPNLRTIEAAQLEVAYSEMLRLIRISLNEVLALDLSETETELILGHWLRRAVLVASNAFVQVSSAAEQGKYQFLDLNEMNFSPTPEDSADALVLFEDEAWAKWLYLRVMRKFKQSFQPCESVTASTISLSRGKKNFQNSIRALAIASANRVIRSLNALNRGSNSALLIGTYLPLSIRFRVGLALQTFFIEELGPTITNKNQCRLDLRENFGDFLAKLSRDSTKEMQFLAETIPEILPKSFFEYLPNALKLYTPKSWPLNPKVIFTSNNFDTDDAFKIYVVRCRRAGANYIVGQHGNNYGTLNTDLDSIEERTADRFLTWGWKSSFQHIPLFNLKYPSSGKLKFDAGGGVLLTQVHASRVYESPNPMHERELYWAFQKDFIKTLSEDIVRNLTVRLHPGYKATRWDDAAHWKDFQPAVNVNTGQGKIGKLVSTSRIVVHSYDSTGLLECLSQGVPTIAFWPGGLSHLRPEAVQDYQLLVSVGIIHLTPVSAAEFINKVWNSIDDWWQSSETIDVVRRFTLKYSRTTESPVRELVSALTGRGGLIETDIKK